MEALVRFIQRILRNREIDAMEREITFIGDLDCPRAMYYALRWRYGYSDLESMLIMQDDYRVKFTFKLTED